MSYGIDPKHKAIADKYAGQPCKMYTLDGIFDAQILGRMERFAVVRTMHGHSMAVSWPTVERKMEGDKLFYIC